MTRDRSAPPEGDFTRTVLEAAIGALPALLRAESCTILLPSAERNALRTVARRNLSEPQAQALAELLAHGEVSGLLSSGRPFLPRSGDGVSTALHARLREDGWPDLIAVPLAGTGRPAGVLVLIPEGDGHWTAARIDGAMRAGDLVAASIRAAARATEGERRRRQVAGLLDHLPLLADRGTSPEDALGLVVGGVGSALGLTHCVGVLDGPRPIFVEFCQPGATPLGQPREIERHPMWKTLQAGGMWSYDDRDASSADRSLTAQLLGDLHPRSLLAAAVARGESIAGYLLLIQADRHRRFTDEEQRFVHAATAELAGAILDDPLPTVEPAERGGGDALKSRAARAAIASAITPAETALALRRALAESCGGVEALLIARVDSHNRRVLPLAALAGRSDVAEVALPTSSLGEDLVSVAVRTGEPATGGGGRALPRPWREWYRPRQHARAVAVPASTGGGEMFVALVFVEAESVAGITAALQSLAPVFGLNLSRADLIERAARRERRLTALNEVLLATASAGDLPTACSEVSAIILRNLPGIDIVNIWLLDQDGETLDRVSTTSAMIADDAFLRSMPMTHDGGATHVVRSRANQVWHLDEDRLPEGLRRFMERAGLVTLASVPMRTVRDVSGTISLGSLRRRTYETDELTFLETLAGQVGSQLDLVQLRQHAEAERRQLLSLVETLPEGLLVMDQDAAIRLFSPVAERTLGQALTGRTVGEVFDGLRLCYPDGRDYAMDDLPFLRVLQGEVAIGVEVVLVRPDETETPLLVNCRPVFDLEGAVSGAICVFQDLTPFQELTSLKSDFVNTVSHELRTPITTIRGGALTLLKRRQFLDEQTQNELLNDIAEESERLHLLVEDLLSLTRSRSGMKVSPEPMLLHRLVNRVIIELGGRVGSHSVQVHVPADLPPVDADPTLIQQVIRNLLENAVKFSPRGQPIEVAAEEE
ncbi:MAG: GAF domain-containing protein, partial [Dehalococcoidia bacterium]